MKFNYGIWYEAWAACCREHNIDMFDKEEDRCTEASENSYYRKEADEPEEEV